MFVPAACALPKPPPRATSPALALEEVIDAQQIYDEMLFFRRFLDAGRVLSTELPDPARPGVLWSGVAVDNAAVVRVVSYAGDEGRLTLSVWADKSIELPAATSGRTFLIERTGEKVVIRSCARDPTTGVSCE